MPQHRWRLQAALTYGWLVLALATTSGVAGAAPTQLPPASQAAPFANNVPAAATPFEAVATPPQTNMQDVPASAPATQDTAADSREPLRARAVTVNIDSKLLNYDTQRDVYVATGNVRVMISEQNSELIADRVTFDKRRNLLFADGNVVIIKNGLKTEGTYARIDLTRESALINDPYTRVTRLQVQAKEAMVDARYVELHNGRLLVDMRRVAAQNAWAQGGFQSPAHHDPVSATGHGAAGGIAAINPSILTPLPPSAPAQFNIGGRPVFEKHPVPLTSAQQTSQSVSPGFRTVADRFREAFKKAKTDDAREALRREQAVLDPEMLDLTPTPTPTEAALSEATSGGFHIKARSIDIRRRQDGIDDITLQRPTLYYGKHRLFPLLKSDIVYDEFNQTYSYLGPDIGFDRNLGGMYFGPGWDFQVGRGQLRFSPLLTYGQGVDTTGGRFEQTEAAPGVGLMAHWRSPRHFVDFGVSSQAGQPILYGQSKLFTEGTKLQYALNQFSANGFLGMQRPNFIAEITDGRKLFDYKNFEIDSYVSAGVARDNFFPNNSRRVFVASNGRTITNGGRVQLQLQLINQKPIIEYRSSRASLTMGFRGQAMLAGYYTADNGVDSYSILRGGPTLNVGLGRFFNSSLQYWTTATRGQTPFVFDTYFAGAQSVSMVNALRLNNYFSVGLSQMMSLKRDNAQEALLVGNQVFVVVGPPEVKLNLAYDFINQRSSFHISYSPGSGRGKQPVDFETLRIFQPANFANPAELMLPRPNL